MTTPPPGRYSDELPPAIDVAGGTVRTAAGTATTARAMVTNRAPEPRILAVTFLGVDADWLPGASRSRVLMPGETVTMDFTLHPAVGTLPAKYPLAVTVQAVDPASGNAMSSAAIADVVLVVDAPGRLEVRLDPPELTRRLRGQVSVQVTNTGEIPEDVRLEIHAPEPTTFTVAESVVVQPGQTRSVPARIAIEPRPFGRRDRFTYTVTARGSGAARRVEGSITTRSIFGNTGPKFFALVLIVSLWAGLAFVFIPKLADAVRDGNNDANDKVSALQDKALDKLRKTQTPSPSAASGAGGSGGSSDGSGDGGSGGSGGGGGGSGSGGGTGSGGSAAPSTAGADKLVQFSGTVAGDSPTDVTVSMRPTSLVDEEAQDAKGVGVDTSSFAELGKIPESALTTARLVAPSRQSQNRSTRTGDDGGWGFSRVDAPGYYLVTFAKPGFQTQRYVLDASSAAAVEPMKTTLLPGKGQLSGRITGPDGAVGGATITLSDGTNTVSTSTNSRGSVGSWSVQGLSTPGSYLLTAFKDGLSTESTIVTLGAGGTAQKNLSLSRNSTTLTGKVTGPDTEGNMKALGGVQVTATSGDTVRTSTTITSGNLTGNYRLPNLPAGRYVVTTIADGYLTQTQPVVIRPGQRTGSVNAELTSASATVTGTVRGVQFNTDGSVRTDADGDPVVAGVNGAGIILSSSRNTYKVTSQSSGSFQMSGVAPGTYTLSAQFAGLETAYATVQVKAGQIVRVPLDSLSLGSAVTVDNSKITGFVSSATNPNGALLCPTGIDPGDEGCQIFFTLVNSDGDTEKISADGSDNFDTTATKAPSQTGPTSYTLTAPAGSLAPGSYRLTVGADGFLPVTLTVRVPANATANAPLAALTRANGVVGTLVVDGNLATDGPAPVPAAGYRTCVYALPVLGLSPTVPTDCNYTPPTTSTCQTRGDAETGFAFVGKNTDTPDTDDDNSSDNGYHISGLCDATYDVYVVTQNPWFTKVTGPGGFDLSRGETATYSPRIVADGKVALTVSVIDASDGSRTSAANLSDLAGSVSCGGDSFGDLATARTNDGVVTVQGVDGGTVTCTAIGATATIGNDADVPLSGRVTNLSVTNDNTTTASLNLNQTIADVSGRLVSAYGASTSNPVSGKTIAVTADVSYDGSAVQTADQTIVTDANGCYAIRQGDTSAAASVSGSGTCTGTIAAASTATFPTLVTRRVSVASAQENGFEPATKSAVLSSGSGVPTDSLIASPISSLADNGDHLFTVTAPNSTPNLTGVSFSVTKVNAAGSGTFNVTADTSGNITWRDSAVAAIRTDNRDLVSPGTYTLTASLTGYTSDTVTISCTFNTTRCDDPRDLVLTRQGGLTGTIVGVKGDSRTYTDPGDGQTKSYPSDNLKQATVTLRQCTDDTYTSCTVGTAKVKKTDDNGVITFDAAVPAEQLAPGFWKMTLTATGYTTKSYSLPIVGGTNTLDGDGTADDNNYLLATPVQVQVGIATSAEQNAPLYKCPSAGGCTVRLTRTLTGVTVATQTTQNATTLRYSFTGIVPGDYSVALSGDGLTNSSSVYPVAPGGTAVYDAPGDVENNTVTGLVKGLQGKSTTPVGLVGVPVELGHYDADDNFVVDEDTSGAKLVTTSTASPTRGTFTFASVPKRTYVLRYNDAASGRTVLTGYAAAEPQQPLTVAGGAADAGSTTLDRVTHKVTATITTTDTTDDISGSTVTLVNTDDATWTFTPNAATANGVSTYTWNQIPFGTWKIQIVLPAGHLGTPSTMSCTGTSATTARTCTSPTITVSGTPGTAADPAVSAYTLDEDRIAFNVVSPAAPKSTPPTSATVTVTTGTGGATTVYSSSSFAITPSTTTGATFTFWSAGNAAYRATVSGLPTNWTAPAATTLSHTATTNLAITEKLADFDVVVTKDTTAGAGVLSDVTLTLTPPAGRGITAPADKTKAGTPFRFSYADQPYGTGWTASATGTLTAADGTETTVTGTATFTVASANPADVSVKVK